MKKLLVYKLKTSDCTTSEVYNCSATGILKVEMGKWTKDRRIRKSWMRCLESVLGPIGVVWELGDASDDEGDGSNQLHTQSKNNSSKIALAAHESNGDNEEVHGLLQQGAPEDSQHRRSMSSEETVVRTDEDIPKDAEEYGNWHDGNAQV